VVGIAGLTGMAATLVLLAAPAARTVLSEAR